MKAVSMVIFTLFLCSCSSDKNIENYRQELMDVDLAFSALSLDSGMNVAFETYCAEDGLLLRQGSMPLVGVGAIADTLAKTDDSKFELSWKPLDGRVASSGDLGYTYGIFTMSLKEMDMTRKGTYVSIWIKEDGEWKFVLDTGNEGLGE